MDIDDIQKSRGEVTVMENISQYVKTTTAAKPPNAVWVDFSL